MGDVFRQNGGIGTKREKHCNPIPLNFLMVQCSLKLRFGVKLARSNTRGRPQATQLSRPNLWGQGVLAPNHEASHT